jgi:hypothetical protein
MAKTKVREEMIRVRFSPDELAIARSRAKAEGVPLSTYLRRLAVTTRAPPAESEERIRRALEAFDAFSADDVKRLRENVREVRAGWARDRR